MANDSASTKDTRGARGVKSINALRRGLDVLFAIERSSAATLAELHRQTSLPKATLLRILKTLQQAGWVERKELDGRYVPTSTAGESGPAVEWRAQLSALAAQPRATLQRRVPWPTDLGVRDGTAMLILDTHRPINGLAVNYRVLGFRPPMLMSSLGRCYLSFCPDGDRKDILDALARSPYQIDRLARRPNSIRRMVAHAREQGYATRDPTPTSIDSPDRFGAISVPVRCAGRVVACLSCAWLPAIASERAVVMGQLARPSGGGQSHRRQAAAGRINTAVGRREAPSSIRATRHNRAVCPGAEPTGAPQRWTPPTGRERHDVFARPQGPLLAAAAGTGMASVAAVNSAQARAPTQLVRAEFAKEGVDQVLVAEYEVRTAAREHKVGQLTMASDARVGPIQHHACRQLRSPRTSPSRRCARPEPAAWCGLDGPLAAPQVCRMRLKAAGCSLRPIEVPASLDADCGQLWLLGLDPGRQTLSRQHLRNQSSGRRGRWHLDDRCVAETVSSRFDYHRQQPLLCSLPSR
jgi:IclR family transcriptional regulator, mhp operon transcriptional activator